MAQLDIIKDIQVKTAKAKDKVYYLNDGGGLRLKVDSTGSKIWEFRFTFVKRSAKLGSIKIKKSYI